MYQSVAVEVLPAVVVVVLPAVQAQALCGFIALQTRTQSTF